MASKKNSGKENGVKSIPPFLPLLAVYHPIAFPSSEAVISMRVSSREAGAFRKALRRWLNYVPYILVASARDITGTENGAPVMGVMALTQSVQEEERGFFVFSLVCLEFRCLINTKPVGKDMEPKDAPRDLLLYPWRIVEDVKPSFQEFSSPAFQEVLKKLDSQSAAFLKKLQTPPIFRFDACNDATVGSEIDRLAGTLGGAIPSSRLITALIPVFRELNIRKRLELLLAIIEEILVHPERFSFDRAPERNPEGTPFTLEEAVAFSDEKALSESPLNKRYDEVRQDLPDEVRTAIESLLPYTKSASESSKMNLQYIEWLLELPWGKVTEDEADFSKVRGVLERDHYNLEQVKERILEFLAVRRIKHDAKAPILCLVGPPGVGKTSLGESIARAMGRKFIRRSLGAVKDEAEIRGHRRTYIGSFPGMMIEGVRKAGTKNPVFMLDEVDKLGEHGGDQPVNALLEALDPKQNATFQDHYIGLPFDLSQVFFITTANTTELIHDTLLNRMEVIELPGYTEDEKIAIAKSHVISRVHEELGITPETLKGKDMPLFNVTFTNEGLRVMVSKYTHDAGMRHTEQAIARILRKVLVAVLEGKFLELKKSAPDTSDGEGEEETPGSIRITAKNIQKYLGEPKVVEWIPDLGNLPPGVCVVLYVKAEDGSGDIGFVEISYRKDTKFDYRTTGSVGEVMGEAIHVAIDRLTHAGGVLEGLSHKVFIHTHYPAGSMPKEGASAGVQTFAAYYSRRLGISPKPYFAATGEIPLRRNAVLPVGGIRAKLLAAERRGIKEVAIPLANRRELEKLPKHMREALRIVIPGETDSGKTLQEISREPKDRFTIYCIDRPEDVLAIEFPEHFPPSPEMLRNVLNGQVSS